MASNATRLLDQLDRQRQDLTRLNRDFVRQSGNIGTDGKDTPALRNNLKKLRARAAEIDGKIATLTKEGASGVPDASVWEQLQKQVHEERAKFELADRDAKAKEKAHPMSTADADEAARGANGDAPAAARAGGAQVRMQDFKQVDMSELHTEDQLQADKLKGILEVESDLNELHSMYRELNTQVVDQQEGLDKTEHHIDQSVKKVEKGVGELKKANKMQKSARWKMCVLIGVILLIIGVVVIIITQT
jgi:chromosome segregation ATPase